MLLENTIHLGDCLELMKEIPDASVDLVLCDLPYGTTACKWDAVIPLERIWEAYRRISRGPIVLTGCEPFSSHVRLSAPDLYRYDLKWIKPQGVDPFMAKIRPLNNFEDIMVFGNGRATYNPQRTPGKPYKVSRDKKPRINQIVNTGMKPTTTINTGDRLPVRTLHFNQERGLHPTQKPVALWEYLIKTYTNPGDLVLDNCAGSGTTAVACKQTRRRYLCIEKDREYWQKACDRVNQAQGFSQLSSLASQTVLDPKSKPPLA